jgi:hypothetical protein
MRTLTVSSLQLVAEIAANPQKSVVALTHVMVASPEEHFFTVYLG